MMGAKSWKKSQNWAFNNIRHLWKFKKVKLEKAQQIFGKESYEIIEASQQVECRRREGNEEQCVCKYSTGDATNYCSNNN